MSSANQAVFLSYASPILRLAATEGGQGAEAARRIAESLPPSLKSYGETRRAIPQR